MNLKGTCPELCYRVFPTSPSSFAAAALLLNHEFVGPECVVVHVSL